MVLLSARADPESTVHALELGADDYIVKPFGARELIARVRSTIDGCRTRAEAAAARGREQLRSDTEGELRALLNQLRAAQRRTSAAADAERRRERDLHDGAQQRLMAIRLELITQADALETGAAPSRSQVDLLSEQLEDALEELRELAQGVYPPLLASDGLYAALSAAARRAPIPVTIQANGLRRAPRAIESAACFYCLEAIQNCAKHAGEGVHAVVSLDLHDGLLEFSVRDDGVGFDPVAVPPRHGPTNLRDRLDALGGHIELTAIPREGTTIRGELPLG